MTINARVYLPDKSVKLYALERETGFFNAYVPESDYRKPDDGNTVTARVVSLHRLGVLPDGTHVFKYPAPSRLYEQSMTFTREFFELGLDRSTDNLKKYLVDYVSRKVDALGFFLDTEIPIRWTPELARVPKLLEESHDGTVTIRLVGTCVPKDALKYLND